MTAEIGLEVCHDSSIRRPPHTTRVTYFCAVTVCYKTEERSARTAVNTVTLKCHAFTFDTVSLSRFHLFRSQIAECSIILNFDVSPDTMTKRLLHRAQTSGRVDDNEDTIKKRLDTFNKHSKPVIECFSSKCKTVSGLPGDLCHTLQFVSGAEPARC